METETKENKQFHKKIKYRVDVQVFIMTAVIVIVSCGIIFFVCYHLAYNGMIRDLEDRGKHIQQYVEDIIDWNTFLHLNSRGDEETRLYINAHNGLARVKEVTGVRYVYTAKKNKNGNFVYVIDGLSEQEDDFRHIGDKIEQECIPDMEKAILGEIVLPEDITQTSWGDIFIAYYPIHADDEVVGVLGLEFDATRQYKTYRVMRISAPIIIAVFCLLSAVIAVALFRRISNPAYKNMSMMDFMTGLKNRNAFEVDLHNFERLKANSEVLIVSADLDKLKQINDMYGHAAGDRYIQLGSEILEECREKFFNMEGTLYRIGGDEFAMILLSKTKEEAEQILEYIKSAQKTDSALKKTAVSMSVGYAFYDKTIDQSLEDTLKRADIDMYQMKANSQNSKRAAAANH